MSVRALFSFPNPVNEVSARLVAAGVVVLAVVTLATRQEWLLAVLAYGFVARVATGPTLSPLGQLVTRVVTPRLGLEPRYAPGPPKRFAQAVGAAFSATAAVLALGLGYDTTPYLLIGVMWAYFYAIVGFFYPQSYMVVGQPDRLVYADALYLSARQYLLHLGEAMAELGKVNKLLNDVRSRENECLDLQWKAYVACVQQARCAGTPESACDSKRPRGDWPEVP